MAWLIAANTAPAQQTMPVWKPGIGVEQVFPWEPTLDLWRPKHSPPTWNQTNQTMPIGTAPASKPSVAPPAPDAGGAGLPPQVMADLLRTNAALLSVVVESLGAQFKMAVRHGDLTLRRAEAGFDAETELRRSQMAVIANNGRESRFIFWVAHGLLLAGVACAFWEFWRAGKLLGDAREIRTLRRKQIEAAIPPAPDRDAPAAAAPVPPPPDELQISLDGITIKTAMRGMGLLLMALAFYFLYLKFVYTLTPVQL